MWRHLCVLVLAVFVMVSSDNMKIEAQTDNDTSSDTSVSTSVTQTTNIPSTSTVVTTISTSVDTTTVSQGPTTTEITSTEAPSTTTTVAPDVGDPKTVNLTLTSEGGHDCLVAIMAVQFKVDYTDASGLKKLKYNLVPNDTINSEKSSCGFSNGSSPILYVDLEGNNYFELTFEKAKDNIYVKQINVSVPLPNAKAIVSSKDNLDLFKVGHSLTYTCTSLQELKLDDNVTVTFQNVRLQVYDTNSTTFDKEYLCDLDRTSDVVPIAVGCALAGLVIIVLIAYLVGRRRSRQKGYQSV